MMHIQSEHLLIFAAVMIPTWAVFIYIWPRLLLSVYKRAILVKGFGEGPIPVNTLYTEPQKLFAEPLTAPSALGASAASSNLMTVGVNHDTLPTVGWLDLREEPLVLHVPAMKHPRASGADASGADASGADVSGRYYSVQFTDPTKNTNFAYVGKRTTGTQAGDYLISGPGWNGQAPGGMPQIASPNNAVLLIGRVLVENDSDLAAAYELSKQITLTPLSHWQPRP